MLFLPLKLVASKSRCITFLANLSAFTALIAFLLFYLLSCDDNPVDKNPPCPPFLTVPIPPYDSPAWHPSSEFIGFNHTPLLKITYPYGEHCQGVYEWESEKSGFWLINSDGTNMRRIFPYKLLNPAWSPDGEWIAFVLPLGDERHICKMKFTGVTFDTTTFVQLTTEGRNFFPSWSPDGEFIAYNRSICNGPQTCGIWIMTKDGNNNRFLSSYGNYPEWYSSNNLFYLTRAVDNSGNAVGDTLWNFTLNINLKQKIAYLNGSNRNIKFLKNKSLIVYWSDGNLWIMDSSGTNQSKISNQEIDYLFSVSPSNEVVYTLCDNTWSYENGTLWIIDLLTGEKRQLTFNLKPNNSKAVTVRP